MIHCILFKNSAIPFSLNTSERHFASHPTSLGDMNRFTDSFVKPIK